MALLAYNLAAGQRGLVKDDELLTWTYPPDFIDRLRRQLAEINPEWAGVQGQADDSPAVID